MAKARNYFGLRTGSTKSKTFSILNGWQIEKDRVYGGKNPRTNAQMRQRMVMATASAAYSGMREIVDHSFEGVTYGQPTMSKFISENAKMLLKGINGTDFVYNDYQDRGCWPNPYLVSKGSIKHNLTPLVDEHMDSVVQVYCYYPNIDPETMTVAEWLKHIGVSLNGYITILCVEYSPETNIHQFGWIRLTPSGQNLDSVLNNVELGEIFDIESNVPIGDTGSSPDVNCFTVNFDFDQGGIKQSSYAVILSEKLLSWKRSTEKMKVYTDMDYTPPTPAESLATYPVGTDYVLNGGNI